MKNWRNDAVAWLLMLSGLGTILLLMGSTFYVVIVQSPGWFNIEGDSNFSAGILAQYVAGRSVAKRPVLLSESVTAGGRSAR
ncbi:hypothetical protein HT118_23500 [Escherichia coli]|nr:hypothetical protein [Escherichia coli]